MSYDLHGVFVISHDRRLRRYPRILQVSVALLLLAAGASTVLAQNLEPRAYSNVPVGTHFLIASYSETRGGVSFDTALPVSGPELSVRSSILGFATVMDLWGKTAKFDIVVPYASLSGSARYQGSLVEREINGFGDPVLRLSWNFHGSPALTAREFSAYRQDLIVGASVQVSVPTGQYDSSKIVNLGTNRWFIKPEVGASKALGPWTLEAKGGVTFFTTNNNFYGGNSRAQDPLYALQGNVIYSFGAGKWMSLDTTYFSGGRTTLNGALSNDLQKNWRTGITLALPVDAQNSVKLFASRGVSSRTGNSFDQFGIAWQHRWGGGV